MAKTLADLKKQSSSLLTKIKATEDERASAFKDNRIWKPKFDKTKPMSYAIIRFLPPPKNEELPYVCVNTHSFRMNGQYYNERSLTNLGQKDPCNELARALYNSEFESDKLLAGNFKKKPAYYANILVIDDPIQPENNGKVFLFKFSRQIFDVMKSRMFPELPSDVPLNPFCPFEGADFEIRIQVRTVGKDQLPNYEKSFFRAQTPIAKDAESIESIWDMCYSLEEIADKKHYTKSYEELSRRLVEIVGPNIGSGIQVSTLSHSEPLRERTMSPMKASSPQRQKAPVREEPQYEDDIPDFPVPKPAASAKKQEVEDDDLEFFRNL